MQTKTEVVIIGAGLTGLTLAHYLQKAGRKFVLLEKNHRAGGVIQTHERDGFVYESGPNTGIVARPEVAELFEALSPNCELDIADAASKYRWILKNGRWEAIPDGVWKAIRTPLFTTKDKFRILGEPFRPKGTNPMETVAGMVRRRMGKSFLDYAVDPFVSGIYAGDPEQLVTQYALPKLYALEQNHGSFIRGAIKLKKTPKTARELKATKEVFSAKGGFSKLVNALEQSIPASSICFKAEKTLVRKDGAGFVTTFRTNNQVWEIRSKWVVTTIGAHALNGMFSFVDNQDLEPITGLRYAKVVQLTMAYKKWNGVPLKAFGGLIPGRENRDLLGVLFPSSIFRNRAPENAALLSVFMGGIKNPLIAEMDDEGLLRMARNDLRQLLAVDKSEEAFVEVFRYKQAIPQYDHTSPQRIERISMIEQKHPGLLLAGNIRDGIGIADRIGQAAAVAKQICETNFPD
jgi:protoporphyrinogen/coproporphyrinogen III oxidase